ncbi:MAG: hypothetical protein KKF10_01405, partial [Verrucomicrobia bacterium]|nr:hypothetical protein [Verrucomicrobiota bacterium]
MRSKSFLAVLVMTAFVVASFFIMSCRKAAEVETLAAAKPTDIRPVSVGYIAAGTWHLRSLFPLFQKEMARERFDAGYIIPSSDEEAFWRQISKFQVLIIPCGYYNASIGAAQTNVFKRYLDAGGGIWLISSTDDLLKKTFPEAGILVKPDRGIQDPVTGFGNYWWTRQIVPHAVTKGIACLAYPKVADYNRVATALAGFSPEWQVLVHGEKSAHIYNVVQEHNNPYPTWKDQGVAGSAPPLLAVRQMGKGRMACLPVRPDFGVYNLGNPGFPQVFMK